MDASTDAEERSLKLLIADDTPINLALLTKLLTRKGHSVTQAENGLIAFEHYKADYFDAVLMDVHMPVMDGLEATQKIRSHEEEAGAPSQIPVIALTANTEPADRDLYLRSGMDAVLTKPIDIKTLIPTIREIIAKKNTGA